MSQPDLKLIPEPPMLVLPSLAAAIGLNEAIVLQQIHFKTRGSGFWWRPSRKELLAAFPFMSGSTLKRTLTRLRERELIAIQSGSDRDRTNQYRVQYGPVRRLNLTPDRPGDPGQSDPVPIGSRERPSKRGDASTSTFSHLDNGTRTA